MSTQGRRRLAMRGVQLTLVVVAALVGGAAVAATQGIGHTTDAVLVGAAPPAAVEPAAALVAGAAERVPASPVPDPAERADWWHTASSRSSVRRVAAKTAPPRTGTASSGPRRQAGTKRSLSR